MFDLKENIPEIEKYLRWLIKREDIYGRGVLRLEYRFSYHNQLYDTSFDPRTPHDPRLTPTIEVDVFWDREEVDHAEFFLYEGEVHGWSLKFCREIPRDDHVVFALNEFGPEFSTKFKQLPLE